MSGKQGTSYGWQESKSKKYACGMCPSCCQKDYCPGGSDGKKCSNYLPPEPTKLDWKRIYIRYLQEAADVMKNGLPERQCKALGDVNIIRAAMLNLHGFSRKELDDIGTLSGIPENDLEKIFRG